MTTDIDHLVVAAHSLAQGVAWCEATLGVAPGPGGKHPLMGTHNRLLRLAGSVFPQAYLEIIAIDGDATAPSRARWFGLDDPALRAALAASPRLLGAVARTTCIDRLRLVLIELGQDPGPALAAERDTPQGKLAWRILVRDDGVLPGNGRLPTLIQWQGRHPTEAMAPSALTLRSVTFGGIDPDAAQLLQLRGAEVRAGGPALQVTLDTPLGAVTLASP